jgi:hypothetical protein
MNGPGLLNAAGGPVGAPPAAQGSNANMDLNTYIYDHLIQTGQFDLARSFKSKNSCRTKGKGKPNGVANVDSKDNPQRPDDLPEAEVMPFHGDTSFLMDWWAMFWDLFKSAHHNEKGTGTVSHQYLV